MLKEMLFEPTTFKNPTKQNEYEQIVAERLSVLLGFFEGNEPRCTQRSDFRRKVVPLFNIFKKELLTPTGKRRMAFKDLRAIYYTAMVTNTGFQDACVSRKLVELDGTTHKIYDDQRLYDEIVNFLNVTRHGFFFDQYKEYRIQLMDIIDKVSRQELCAPFVPSVVEKIDELKNLNQWPYESFSISNAKVIRLNAKISLLEAVNKKSLDTMRIIYDDVKQVTSAVVDKNFSQFMPPDPTLQQKQAIFKARDDATELLQEWYLKDISTQLDVLGEYGADDVDCNLHKQLLELKMKVAELENGKEIIQVGTLAQQEVFFKQKEEFFKERQMLKYENERLKEMLAQMMQHDNLQIAPSSQSTIFPSDGSLISEISEDKYVFLDSEEMKEIYGATDSENDDAEEGSPSPQLSDKKYQATDVLSDLDRQNSEVVESMTSKERVARALLTTNDGKSGLRISDIVAIRNQSDIWKKPSGTEKQSPTQSKMICNLSVSVESSD